MTKAEENAADEAIRLEADLELAGLFTQTRLEDELIRSGQIGPNDYVALTQEGDALVATVIRDK